MNLVDSDILSEIRQFLADKSEVMVVTHFSPDGDAVGSILAFGGILDQLGIPHVMAIDDVCPDKYSFLPGYDKVRNLKEQSLDDSDLNKKGKPVVKRLVTLDIGALPRIGSANDYIDSDTKILNIDHHLTGQTTGHINLVDVEAAATTEILYDLCKALEIPLSDQIRYGIFVGLVTDTGRFRFSNTNLYSFKICGELVDQGVDSGKVMENIFYNQSFEMMCALGMAITTIKRYNNDLLCILGLEEEKYIGDTEGFVEFAASVRGVLISCFYCKMSDGRLKVSLRSRCDIDVSEIARELGGGGHRKAAGFRFDSTSDELRNLLVVKIGKELELLGYTNNSNVSI